MEVSKRDVVRYIQEKFGHTTGDGRRSNNELALLWIIAKCINTPKYSAGIGVHGHLGFYWSDVYGMLIRLGICVKRHLNHSVEFDNGSKIHMVALDERVSDPDFHRLWSKRFDSSAIFSSDALTDKAIRVFGWRSKEIFMWLY